MRHVDEGTLHAWLDGQVTAPADVAWIEQHVRNCEACSNRLLEERAAAEQARALLDSVAPAADTSREAFAALVARAKAETPENARAERPRARTWRAWTIPVTWAASVALAAILGWTAHDRMTVERGVADSAPSERPVAAVADASSTESAAPSLSDAAAADTPASPRPAPSPRVERPSRGETPAARTQALAERSERSAAEAAGAAPPPPAASAAPAPRSRSEQGPPSALLGLLSESETGGAAVDIPAAPPAETGGRASASPSARVLQLPPGQPADSGVAQAPQNGQASFAPPPPSGTGGGIGGRGGARGGGLGVGAAPGRVVVDGTPVATAAASAPGAWRAVARTEAAALSGMPLYGIGGLTPEATFISADASAVRTIYRLENGGAVELEQQRVTPDRAGSLSQGRVAAEATVAAETPVVDVQSTRRQIAAEPGIPDAQAGAADLRALVPFSAVTFANSTTVVRDGVQLTVRANDEVAPLAGRLRLD